jgi:hypothetical protein
MGGTVLNSSAASSLDLDFLTGDTLDPRVSFSRSSQAWQYDATGTLVPGPSNSLLNSQDFAASTWTKNSATVAGSVAAGPLGDYTGDLITATNATAYVAQSVTFPPLASVTASFHVKAGSVSWMRIRVQGGAEIASVWFNLATGAVGSVHSIAGIVLSNAAVSAAGGGWWRVSARISAPTYATLSIGAGVAPADASGSTVAGDSIYLWGAMAEAYAGVRGYVSTSVRNVLPATEAFDNAAHSKANATISANAIASPITGIVDADKLAEDATASAPHSLQTAITLQAGSRYTASIYVKAAERSVIRLLLKDNTTGSNYFFAYFDLITGTVTSTGQLGTGAYVDSGMVGAGGGWWRCHISGVPFTTGTAAALQLNLIASGTNTNYSGTAGNGVHIWGGMVEASGSLGAYVYNSGAAPASAVAYGPRFDYDPVTKERRGLLVEETRANLLPYSEHADTWVKSAVTVAPALIIAPSGDLAAEKIIENTANVSHYTGFAGVTVVSGAAYTFSIYAKAGERAKLAVEASSGAVGAFQFDLSAGIMTAGTAGATATMTQLSNGWWRCTQTWTTTATAINIQVRIIQSGTGTFQSYAGDGVSGLYLYGAMLEAGGFSTSYIPTPATFTGRTSTATYHDAAGVLQTAASGVARYGYGHTGTAWVPQGLILEGAATNSLRNSSASGAVVGAPGTTPTTWGIGTSNGVGREIAGTGTENGIPYVDIRFVGTATAIANPFVLFEAVDAIAAANGQTWTGSVYLKAVAGSMGAATMSRQMIFYTSGQTSIAGGVSIATVPGTGALNTQRFATTNTATDATTAFIRHALVFNIPNGTVFDFTLRLGMPQVEQGGTATSPILTTGSATATRAADTSTSATATRAGDVAVARDLSGWFNQSEGTLITEFAMAKVPPPQTQYAVTMDDGGANNQTALYVDGSSQMVPFIVAGGATQVQFVMLNGVASGTVYRAALAYRQNDCAFAVNGGAVSTDSVATMPPVTRMNIGNRSDGTRPMTGYARKIRYWRTRKSNADLQTLTTL